MKVSVPSTHHHCIKTSCEQNQNENQFLDKLKRCFACIFPFSNPNHRQEYDRQNMNSLIATEANSRHASVATSATGGTIMTMEISEGSQPHSISRSREDVGYLLQQQPTQHQHQQQRRRQLENQIHISSSRQNSRAMVSSNEEKETSIQIETTSDLMNTNMNNLRIDHLESIMSSTLTRTTTAEDVHSFSNSSKPIPCPIPNSSDQDSKDSFQREVEYYNKATWTMYNRIMHHRIKRQQEEQQQKEQHFAEHRYQTLDDNEYHHGEDDEDEVSVHYEHQQRRQQQRQRDKKQKKNRSKKSTFARKKSKSKVQPLIDESNKTFQSSNLLPLDLNSHSAMGATTIASNSTLSNSIRSTSTTNTNNCKNDNNEIVFQLEL